MVSIQSLAQDVEAEFARNKSDMLVVKQKLNQYDADLLIIKQKLETQDEGLQGLNENTSQVLVDVGNVRADAATAVTNLNQNFQDLSDNLERKMAMNVNGLNEIVAQAAEQFKVQREELAVQRQELDQEHVRLQALQQDLGELQED